MRAKAPKATPIRTLIESPSSCQDYSGIDFGGKGLGRECGNVFPLLCQAEPYTHLTPPGCWKRCQLSDGCCAMFNVLVSTTKWPTGPNIGFGHLVVETSTLNIAQQPSDS